MRWLARLTLKVMPLLMVAACTHDPIQYIPETDRTLLRSQDRMGTGGDTGNGPISVDEMLRRAKAASPAKPATTRLVLRFDGDTVQPDQAQRETLRTFASQAPAGTVIVTSRPGSFDDPANAVIGPRRAVAVSHELTAVMSDVQVRFEPWLPAGVVVVSLGSRQAAP